MASVDQEKLVEKLRTNKLDLTHRAMKADAYRIHLLSDLASTRHACMNTSGPG
jgi:hypothetical protein